MKTIRRKSTFVVAGLGVVALLLWLHGARAMTIIPPSTEISAKPGDVVRTTVKLFNETNLPITEYSSVQNFRPKDETGTPDFITESTLTDLASWMSIEPGPFTLDPGARQEIPVTITIPADADPGGHYAAVLFSSKSPEASGGGEIGISFKVASLILVRVAGQINERASIASFATSDGKTMYTRLPITFALRMTNEGNVHVRPTGKIAIRNMIGGTTSELTLNDSQGAVLPQSTRRFDVLWEKNANDDASQGNFFQEVAHEWRNFAFGPYTANLTLSYGQANDKTLTGSFSFWIFPWQLLIVLIVAILVLVWLIIWLVKVYNAWIISKAGKSGKK